MSSPEEVDLQILGKDGEESQVAKYSERQEPLERQPDAVDKGAASQQTTSLRKKISLTACVDPAELHIHICCNS